MITKKQRLSANNQYLGTCKKCKQHGAVLESFCSECRVRHRTDFLEEINKMGFRL